MVIPLNAYGLKLSETAIFKGMSEEEIQSAMRVLQAHDRSYKKGETVFHAGETTDSMGLMLEGSVTIRSDDLWGNRTILSHVGPGQFFAETYAFLREMAVRELAERASEKGAGGGKTGLTKQNFEAVDVGLIFLREGGLIGSRRSFPRDFEWDGLRSRVLEAARGAALGDWPARTDRCRECPWAGNCPGRRRGRAPRASE